MCLGVFSTLVSTSGPFGGSAGRVVPSFGVPSVTGTPSWSEELAPDVRYEGRPVRAEGLVGVCAGPIRGGSQWVTWQRGRWFVLILRK